MAFDDTNQRTRGMSGHYRMHRGWMDKKWMSFEPFDRRSAWVWLIENANWKDYNGVKRGELNVTQRELAKIWKWSKTKVVRYLEAAQEANAIRTTSDKFRTIITICNYDIYQASEESSGPRSGPQADHVRTTTGPLLEEGKEGKKEDIPIAKAIGGEAPQDLFGESPASNVTAIKPKEAEPPPAPTAKKLIYEIGLPLFMSTGRSRDASAKIIGRFLRENGEEAVYEAITETVAKDPGGDPVSYCQGVLKGGSGWQYDDNGNWSPFGHPRPPGVKRKPEKPWSPFH